MLDASLRYSFLTRDKDKNILGMSSNLGWHSEASGDSENLGTMMINSHHKMNIDYDAQLNKFGQQILDFETCDNNMQQQPVYEDPEEVEKLKKMNHQIQMSKMQGNNLRQN